MIETQLDYDTLNDSYFTDMANILLNECYLLVDGKKFRLVEIEFYLNCNGHPDPYTHDDPNQLLMHTFYFHKFKTGTYKSGTFKGMDLTFGNEEESAYFGILIRAIKDMVSGTIIEGPCNVVNKILNIYNCDSIMDFTQGENLDIFENRTGLCLVLCEDLIQEEIFWGPRIGLSAKFPEYHKKYYRYVADKSKIKKQKTSLVKI